MKNLLHRLFKWFFGKYLSGWVVLFFDLILVVIAVFFAWIVRNNFEYVTTEYRELYIRTIYITGCYLLAFLYTRSYSGIIRHTGLSDVFRIIKALIYGFSLGITGTVLIRIIFSDSILVIPFSLSIIHFLMVSFALVMARFVIKFVFLQAERNAKWQLIHVLIFGAGEAGLLTKEALLKDKLIRYKVLGFIDDNPQKISKRIEGTPIYGREDALNEAFIKKHRIQQVVISAQNMQPNERKKLIERVLELKIALRSLPPVSHWIDGKITDKQLKRVRIEELLERDVIRLDSSNIRNLVKGKVVLVTGAAGSIGSEIVRQLVHFDPARIVAVDQAETPVYQLEYEISQMIQTGQRNVVMAYLVADVRDRIRLSGVFETFCPHIVFHAAAYKHVPIMENQPYEAVAVNVFGTKTIADLAVQHQAERFVYISTDKAVNPTNIMGASKRIAELYIQNISRGKTKFITTRFGNVLGSNGSVVPLFRKQIKSGGPVTITHREITRFFMTIPEACNLVLEAGSIGSGNDIYIFDMGEPVKIYEMAKKMIQLHGFQETEISIKEIGLRPGEKLYEELLLDKEKTLPTDNPKIMRAKKSSCDPLLLEQLFGELQTHFAACNDLEIVRTMKKLVPEFKSKNSRYEEMEKEWELQ